MFAAFVGLSVVLLGCRYDEIATVREGCWYTVCSGDSLYLIALCFCVNREDILAANNMNNDSTFAIRPGMRIWIPKKVQIER